MMHDSKTSGFTLAELLIALTLLGVIAVFTIPKVMTSVAENGYNAKAKAFAMQLQNAYAEYQMENQPTGNTSLLELTPYLSYVKVDTTSQGDRPSATLFDCYSGYQCLRMQDGSLVRFATNYRFSNTYSTNATYVYYDPDGKPSSGTGLQLWLYYDGNVLSKSTLRPNTCDLGGCVYTPGGWEADPAWFSWDK